MKNSDKIRCRAVYEVLLLKPERGERNEVLDKQKDRSGGCCGFVGVGGMSCMAVRLAEIRLSQTAN